jgi:hypothetical protein
MQITNKNTAESGIRKRTISRDFKLGPISLSFVTIIIFAALSLFYLAESTQGATNGYKIQELNNKKVELEEDNKRLEVESVRLKSLSEIKKVTENGNLEENKDSQYLTSSDQTADGR